MASKIDAKIDFDPYELMNVGHEADEKEILKAYRKMALKWHPDKNPDKKVLAEKMFLKLSKALEILTDKATRAALDQVRKARAAAALRHQGLDAKRRKLKEELEAREAKAFPQQSAANTTSANVDSDEVEATKRLQKEIERLRKEGSKLLQRERENIEREVHKQQHTTTTHTHHQQHAHSSHHGVAHTHSRLRVRWTPVNDLDYDHDSLTRLFTKYGPVVAVVVSSKKKKRSAIIEFESQAAANKALEVERGQADCPLAIEKMADADEPQLASQTQDRPNGSTRSTQSSTAAQSSATQVPKYASFPDTPIFAATNSMHYHGVNSDGSTIDINDFESIVLMKMRQAEERKRLIQQINNGDDL